MLITSRSGKQVPFSQAASFVGQGPRSRSAKVRCLRRVGRRLRRQAGDDDAIFVRLCRAEDRTPDQARVTAGAVIGATKLDPMKIQVKAGAPGRGRPVDGAQMRRGVHNGVAYGNPRRPVSITACGVPLVLSLPDKKVRRYELYTTNVPAGLLAGYGVSKRFVAVESAIDGVGAASEGTISSSSGKRRLVRAKGWLSATGHDDGRGLQSNRPRAVVLDWLKAAMRDGRAPTTGPAQPVVNAGRA